jgi:hypothetical protein
VPNSILILVCSLFCFSFFCYFYFCLDFNSHWLTSLCKDKELIKHNETLVNIMHVPSPNMLKVKHESKCWISQVCALHL